MRTPHTRGIYSCEICDPTGVPRANARAMRKGTARERGGGFSQRKGADPTAQIEKEAPEGQGRRGNQRWRARARGARYAVQSRPGLAPGPAIPGGGRKGGPRRPSPLIPHLIREAPVNVCKVCLCERLPRTPFRGLWVCVWPSAP